MKWRQFWPEYFLAAVVIALEAPQWSSETRAASTLNDVGWTSQRKLAAREKTRDLWYHGFDNYMEHAFPLDELTPLSCRGQGPDWNNPQNFAANDVAGNFSLTLIDVLDTFVVLQDRQGFEQAVRNVIKWVSFDVNTKPQVFETTIRVLGGLLSGHIFANQTGPFHLPWYHGELLELARDLGERLLPAFSTPTGLPYARINLRHGVMKGEILETCTAGAGSLILEFATLSRLTGDIRFEKAAYKAFFAIWNRRSDIGLVGNTINTWTGAWTSPTVSGIGAGMDSFYEYALKWYVMSGEVEFLDVWDDSYAAIMRYARSTDGFWYHSVNMNSGDVAYNTVDSLSAFWPGLQVLAGDIQNAIKSHMMYYNLWRTHSGLPEVYDTHFQQATSHQYPLRPGVSLSLNVYNSILPFIRWQEFIESTWYLYRATGDDFYLDVGERVLFDLTTRARVNCGLTGISDLRSNTRDDRMESFMLSETLKYLYLLFDEGNPIHTDDSNYVFTTEGHILTLGREHLKPISASRRKMRNIENHQCPAYQPLIGTFGKNRTGLVMGVRSRSDVDYARKLVDLAADDADKEAWSADGWCQKPKMKLFAYDFILSSDGKVVPEDLSPSLLKLAVVDDGFVINNVTGIRTHIVQRLDGKGYDVRKVGHYLVRSGHLVYINDTSLFLPPSDRLVTLEKMNERRALDVSVRFFVDAVDPAFQIQPGSIHDLVETMELVTTGFTALFGGDLADKPPPESTKPLRFSDPEGVPIFSPGENRLGCVPFNTTFHDGVVLVERGGCTFLEKLMIGRAAGAAGVLVVSDEDFGINPTANPEDLAVAGDISDVAILVVTRQVGEAIKEMVQQGMGQVMLVVEPEQPQVAVTDAADDVLPDTTQRDREKEKAKGNHPRILYLNGHPLLNTRLLV